MRRQAEPGAPPHTLNFNEGPMLNKLINISAAFIMVLFLAVLPLEREWTGQLFPALVLAAGIVVLRIGLDWRRSRAARRNAGEFHYLLDTGCLLNRDILGRNLDEESSALLDKLLNQGCRDGRLLQPDLEKALGRLKKLAARQPSDPGPWAYQGWCLVLLSRIAGRDAALDSGGEIPEKWRWKKAEAAYVKALELAPDEGHIHGDRARVLEERAWLLSARGEDPSGYFEAALKQYEAAARADVELKTAWRGRGRILARQVTELGREPALDLLTEAVDFYEQARGDHDWGWDFYEEFGQTAFTLAQYHPLRAVHYFRYAARLFLLAAEMNNDSPAVLIQAGRAFHQAAFTVQDQDERQAESLYLESLECFRAANRGEPGDAAGLLWTARTLSALYTLFNGREKADDPDGAEQKARAWLDEAADLCARASALEPSEEVFSDWANILSLKAENGGSRSGELWAATARKYASAVAQSGDFDERSAVNWHNWAYALSALAETRPSPAGRSKLLARAAAKYEKAAQLNKNNVVTLKNWGDVLGDLADLADEPGEDERLASLAEAKFREATELYPDQAGPWRRWSYLIQRRARREKNPGRRRELWQAALDKLERGVRAEPDSVDTWIMWGQALSELYWEAAEYERPLLISGIVEKYEKALALDSDEAENWTLLGRARLEASEVPADLSACGDELENATAALEAFKAACALSPQEAGLWADWGRALFRLSQILDNEASVLAVLKEAGEKYETAVALEPEHGEHHTGLGHIFYQWGWRLEEPELRRAKFKEAYEHCAQAGRLNRHDPVVWRNWGKVIEALATVEKDPLKSFDWQSEADEKFYYADIIDSSQSRDRRH